MEHEEQLIRVEEQCILLAGILILQQQEEVEERVKRRRPEEEEAAEKEVHLCQAVVHEEAAIRAVQEPNGRAMQRG